MKLTTTLNKIRQKNPCESGLNRFIAAYPNIGDDTEVDLYDIINNGHNTVTDVLRVLRATLQDSRHVSVAFAKRAADAAARYADDAVQYADDTDQYAIAAQYSDDADQYAAAARYAAAAARYAAAAAQYAERYAQYAGDAVRYAIAARYADNAAQHADNAARYADNAAQHAITVTAYAGIERVRQKQDLIELLLIR